MASHPEDRSCLCVKCRGSFNAPQRVGISHPKRTQTGRGVREQGAEGNISVEERVSDRGMEKIS
jgi:hypothetical protein